MITLDDDFSLSDVLKAINKHYSFSYTEIIKEARALNQQSVSIPVISKLQNSSTSKSNEWNHCLYPYFYQKEKDHMKFSSITVLLCVSGFNTNKDGIRYPELRCLLCGEVIKAMKPKKY